jgi:glycosyltransferase involved in cell wall biosynthesis
LIKALIEQNFTVHISAPNVTPAVIADVAALGAQLHDVPLSRTGQNFLADFGYCRALCRLIRTLKPDHVLGYTIKPNIWGSFAARWCGVRSTSLVTGLGYAFIEMPGLKRKLIQSVAKLLYRIATTFNARVIFQNSDDMRDFIAGHALGDTSKARLVNGSGVDMAHFTPAPLPAEPVFLLIARLLRSKGVEEYAAAAHMVKSKLPGARFLLAGFLDEGPDAITASQLDEWVQSGIEYLGPLDDVRPALAMASVYVLPSWREGTPRTVLEAMAMARAVITTDAPGCRQTVEPGQTGLLVPVNDAPALAAAMQKLAYDEKLRTQMGEAGYVRVKRLYEASAVAHSTLEAMSLLAGSRPSA